jgi:hypothetical protein
MSCPIALDNKRGDSSRDAVIWVYDEAGNVIKTQEPEAIPEHIYEAFRL